MENIKRNKSMLNALFGKKIVENELYQEFMKTVDAIRQGRIAEYWDTDSCYPGSKKDEGEGNNE